MTGERWTSQPTGALRFRGDERVLVVFAVLWTVFWSAYMQAAYSAGVPLVMWASASIFIAYGLWAAGRTLHGALARRRRAYSIDEETLLVTDTRTDSVVLRVDRTAISELSVERHRGGNVTLWGRVGDGDAEPLLEMIQDSQTALEILSRAPALRG